MYTQLEQMLPFEYGFTDWVPLLVEKDPLICKTLDTASIRIESCPFSLSTHVFVGRLVASGEVRVEASQSYHRPHAQETDYCYD